MFGPAKLAEYDLALRHSATGNFRDVFLGVDQFPILSVGAWLLEDLGAAAGPAGLAAERSLFVASMLLALRVHTLGQLRDPSSFAEDGHLALVDFCTARAKRELATLMRDRTRMSELDSVLDTPADDAATGSTAGPDAYLRPRWSAPSRVIALAAAEAAGAPGRSVSAAQILDRLATAVQIREDVESLDRDLHHGRLTYPIAVIAQAAGVPLSPRPEPTRLLGAMIATGTLPSLLERAETLVAEALGAARALPLPNLAAYLEAALEHFGGQRARAAGGWRARPAPRGATPLIAQFEPTVPKAIDMAARSLLADRTFRESWETHREGMLGADEVASRYPAGLILEILQRHGHDVASEIGEFLAFTVANGFRYYDHASCDPDTDTLGVFLRLRATTNQPDVHADAVDRMVGCLERRVLEERRIPVWVRDCEPAGDGRRPILALGEGCGTVAAHLLLGLLSLPSGDGGPALELGARSLVDRLCDVGVGANVNYPRLYALASWFRLLSALAAHARQVVTTQTIDEARDRLMGELTPRLAVDAATPQGAALATIACRAAMRADLVEHRWESTIVKRQRSDGSWVGEPFAAAPNRGGWVSWYSSSTLTTALCYDALAGAAAP